MIGLSPVTYSTQIQIQSYREQYTVYKYAHVKHNYHSRIITYHLQNTQELLSQMMLTGVNTSTMLPVRQLRHWVSYTETWPWLQRKLASPMRVCSTYIWNPHHQTEINRIEKVQRTAAHWACRCWRNQSHIGEMLEELQWPELQERIQEATLTLFLVNL